MIFDALCVFLSSVSGMKDDKPWFRAVLLSEDYTPFKVYCSDPIPSDLHPGDRVICKFKVTPDNQSSFFRLKLLSIVLYEN